MTKRRRGDDLRRRAFLLEELMAEEHKSPPLGDMNAYQRELDAKKRDEAGETIAAVTGALTKTLTGRYPQAVQGQQQRVMNRTGK
jgi:hypothetical protein